MAALTESKWVLMQCLFVLKSQSSSGEDFKPLSETPPRKQRGLFSDEEDSEVSTSLISPYRNPWDVSHPDLSPLISGDSLFISRTGNCDIHAATLSNPESSFLAARVKCLGMFSLSLKIAVGLCVKIYAQA